MLYHYPSDHAIFDSGRHGSRDLSEDELERRLEAGERQQQELLALFGGDRTTLELLLRFFDGGISCRELGTALGVNASTAWRQVQRCLAECRHAKAVEMATGAFRAEQGFLLDVRKGEHVLLRTGCAVPLSDHCHRFAFLPSASEIEGFLRDQAKMLDTAHGPKHFFGGWIDSGFHLSVTRLTEDAAEAVTVARDHRQRFVFDFAQERDSSAAGKHSKAA